MQKVIVIGSGFSGIAMGIALLKKNIDDFIILEKAASLGGTWRENTYPGAECDIPSALYSYSFEPYPDWEYKWSHQPQILEYLNHCSDKYKVTPKIKFNEKVISIKWNETDKHWVIQTTSTKYQSQHVVSAVGQLHHSNIPNFKGKENFLGPSWHSAHWNHRIDLTNKNIGVIGNAASAVQFIPEIAKVAGSLKVFQRSPNWMLPKQDRLYKEWEKSIVRTFPLLLKLYRLRIWLLGGALFTFMKSGNNILRRLYQGQCIKYIKKHIKDPEHIRKLIPKYPFGAKRVLFSDNYYAALAQDNVTLITDPIQSITSDGVQTSTSEEEIDILIYATGFTTNPFLQHIDVQGKNNLSIQKHWSNGPQNYLGICTNNFPNLWMMYGPNTNLGHNSIILMSEAQANYIAQIIHQNDHKIIEVKENSVKEYYKEIQYRLQKMIWNQIENSWYKSANGDIPNNWPGRTMEYIRRTKNWNSGDFEIN